MEPGIADLQELEGKELREKDCRAHVLRLDRLHPVVSGNKWFKLKYYLQAAEASGKSGLLTFGGAWSNHIVAAAYAAKERGLHTAGIIRGEKPPILSGTLQMAATYGMRLLFVSREQYSAKEKDPMIRDIIRSYPQYDMIPEGGAGPLGVKGCAEILSLAEAGIYTHILCAVGTGTMFNGLLSAVASHTRLIGIPVLKGMKDDRIIDGSLPDHKKRQAVFYHDYHFGGYARQTPALLRFMNDFYTRTGIPTDFVYTGKLVFAFEDLLEKDHFPRGSRILLIHSGGLQGNTSLAAGSLVF